MSEKDKKITELERRIFNLEMFIFGKSGNRWHSTGELPTGEKTGTIGASTYIVDSKGSPVSPGFHSIKQNSTYRYEGSTGARKERFTLRYDEIEMKNNFWDKPRID